MGSPNLRRVSRDISNMELQSLWLADLVNEMARKLDENGEIGLAAPQINVNVRLFIIEFSGGFSRYGDLSSMSLRVFVNPQVSIVDNTNLGVWEHCQSLPGLRGYVQRSRRIFVEYLDVEGNEYADEFDGLMAAVIQHEFDHLDGILYPDQMHDIKSLVFEDEFKKHYAKRVDPAIVT